MIFVFSFKDREKGRKGGTAERAERQKGRNGRKGGTAERRNGRSVSAFERIVRLVRLAILILGRQLTNRPLTTRMSQMYSKKYCADRLKRQEGVSFGTQMSQMYFEKYCADRPKRLKKPKRQEGVSF
jgi:hypothetical protein